MKKFLLSLALVLTVCAAWAQDVARLKFTRTGTEASSVTISVVDENDEEIEGASATLTSASHVFKTTAGNVTENILCPNINGNTNPTITLTFTVTGLNEFYTFNNIGLHIHALNGSNGYQETNDGKVRQWNVDVDANESDFGSLSDIDIAAGISGANKIWEVSGTSNTGKELIITLTITKGTTNGGCFFGLSEIKLMFNENLAPGEIPSGFYRFQHYDSDRYLYAPETLPTGRTEDNNNFKATFSAPNTVDTENTHRDIWYIENLGKNDTVAAEANNVIYKIWCFQGGYGLATNPNPSVYGSFDARYCPRLYNLKINDEGYYTIAGHVYDKTATNDGKNVAGIFTGAGAIGNSSPLKPSNANYTMLARDGNASNSETWWRLLPVGNITQTVSIGSTGVATFAFTSDTHVPDGIEAYVATENGDVVKLTNIGETIPARSGVILRNTQGGAGDFTFNAKHGLGLGMSAVNTNGSLSPVSDNGNLLKGTLKETTLEAGDYILTKKKVNGVATDEVVFGKISGTSNIAAFKAYLPKENVASARGFFELDWNEETGIDEAKTENGQVKAEVYDLAGRRVQNVKKGIFIVNGKIVIK